MNDGFRHKRKYFLLTRFHQTASQQLMVVLGIFAIRLFHTATRTMYGSRSKMPCSINRGEIAFLKILKLFEPPGALNIGKQGRKKLSQISGFNGIEQFTKARVTGNFLNGIKGFQVMELISIIQAVLVKLKQRWIFQVHDGKAVHDSIMQRDFRMVVFWSKIRNLCGLF